MVATLISVLICLLSWAGVTEGGTVGCGTIFILSKIWYGTWWHYSLISKNIVWHMLLGHAHGHTILV